MGLETGTTIASLNAAWPLGSDPKSQGDDHLRLVKAVVKSDAVAKAPPAAASQNIVGPLTLFAGQPNDNTALGGLGGGTVAARRTGHYEASLNVGGAGVRVASLAGAAYVHLLHDGASAGIVRLFRQGGANAWDLRAGPAGNANLLLLYDSATLGSFNSTTGAYTALSDAGAKVDAEAFGGLSLVDAIEPKRYGMGDEHAYGFIAQEVEPVIPEAVSPLDETRKGVDHNQLVAVLWQAVRELTARVEELEAGAELRA